MECWSVAVKTCISITPTLEYSRPGTIYATLKNQAVINRTTPPTQKYQDLTLPLFSGAWIGTEEHIQGRRKVRGNANAP
jgi:hypothetical protein